MLLTMPKFPPQQSILLLALLAIIIPMNQILLSSDNLPLSSIPSEPSTYLNPFHIIRWKMDMPNFPFLKLAQKRVIFFLVEQPMNRNAIPRRC
jgi:hypothetical protein